MARCIRCRLLFIILTDGYRLNQFLLFVYYVLIVLFYLPLSTILNTIYKSIELSIEATLLVDGSMHEEGQRYIESVHIRSSAFVLWLGSWVGR